MPFVKDKQYYKFCLYGFLKNLRFFDAFFILFLLQRDLNYTQIGSLYALREIITNLSEIPTGILADLYGRRNTLAFSFLFYIASFVFFLTAHQYVLFLIAFSLYGMADAFRSGTHKAMIMDYLKQQNWSKYKITYYGQTRACSQRGSAISALIAGIIVFYSGNYKSIFMLSIIPYIINFGLILTYPKILNKAVAKHQKSFKIFFKDIKLVLTNPKVLAIVHSSAVYSAYLKVIKDYIQVVIKNLLLIIPIGVGLATNKRTGLFVGVIYFLLYVLTSIASSKSGYFVRKNKSSIAHKTLIFGLVVGCISGYFYYSKVWIVAFIGFVILYLIENIRKPILTGFLADQVPNEVLASVISAQSLYKTLLTSIIALVFGYFADIFGLGYALVFISVGLWFLTIILTRIAHLFSL